MKFQLPSLREVFHGETKIKQAVRMRDIPFLFERYELFVVIIGFFVVFLVAGLLFYEKAYKTVRAIPDVSVESPQIKQSLFDKTVEELARKKQPPPAAPIIDPFR